MTWLLSRLSPAGLHKERHWCQFGAIVAVTFERRIKQMMNNPYMKSRSPCQMSTSSGRPAFEESAENISIISAAHCQIGLDEWFEVRKVAWDSRDVTAYTTNCSHYICLSMSPPDERENLIKSHLHISNSVSLLFALCYLGVDQSVLHGLQLVQNVAASLHVTPSHHQIVSQSGNKNKAQKTAYSFPNLWKSHSYFKTLAKINLFAMHLVSCWAFAFSSCYILI